MKFEYKIIKKTDDQLSISVELFKTMDCFDGHFEEVSIMPAVAQLYIVEKIAKKYFKQLVAFKGLQQVKFVGPICPDTEVTINIDVDVRKQQLTFEYQDTGVIKSKGKLNFIKRHEDE